MSKTIKHFIRVVDYHTAIVLVLALAATWLCRSVGLVVDLPTNLIGIAVIFPLVFSINSAYKRREEALKAFANFKGHLISIYYAHRDWVEVDEGHEVRSRQLLGDLLTAVSAQLKSGAAQTDQLTAVYDCFSGLSRSHEQLRAAGVPANEISRLNQYLRALIIQFETMHNIARYRTPVALRAYSRLFLNLFPVLFGPFFANIAYPEWPLTGYLVAIIYTLVLVSLDNIQDDLENPFDGIGQDDLQLGRSEQFLQYFE